MAWTRLLLKIMTISYLSSLETQTRSSGTLCHQNSQFSFAFLLLAQAGRTYRIRAIENDGMEEFELSRSVSVLEEQELDLDLEDPI